MTGRILTSGKPNESFEKSVTLTMQSYGIVPLKRDELIWGNQAECGRLWANKPLHKQRLRCGRVPGVPLRKF